MGYDFGGFYHNATTIPVHLSLLSLSMCPRLPALTRSVVVWLIAMTMLVVPFIGTTPEAWAQNGLPTTTQSLADNSTAFHHCDNSQTSAMTEISESPSITQDCCTLAFHFCCSPLLAIQVNTLSIDLMPNLVTAFPAVSLGFEQTFPQGLYRPPLA